MAVTKEALSVSAVVRPVAAALGVMLAIAPLSANAAEIKYQGDEDGIITFQLWVYSLTAMPTASIEWPYDGPISP